MDEMKRLRGYLSKASFATEADRLAALECVDALAAMEGKRLHGGAVEVCPECDIAGCRHIRARAALAAQPVASESYAERMADDLADAIFEHFKTPAGSEGDESAWDHALAVIKAAQPAAPDWPTINAVIARHFANDPANACRAHAAIAEVLLAQPAVSADTDDAPPVAAQRAASAEPVLRIYAEGSMRTVTEWLDGARDLPDGDHTLYAAPVAAQAQPHPSGNAGELKQLGVTYGDIDRICREGNYRTAAGMIRADCVYVFARDVSRAALAAQAPAANADALPTGATLRCRRCGDTADVAFSYSGSDQAPTIELLRQALIEMRHARKFIASREQMHPVGIEQFDQACAAIDAAIAQQRKGEGGE